MGELSKNCVFKFIIECSESINNLVNEIIIKNIVNESKRIKIKIRIIKSETFKDERNTCNSLSTSNLKFGLFNN